MKKFVFLMLVLAGTANAQIFRDTTSFVRPANATAYAAGDIVCGAADSSVLRFPNFNSPTPFFLVAASLEVDTASTAGSFRLFLFRDTTSFAKIGDNQPYVAKDQMMRQLCLGFVDFTLTSAGVGASSGGNIDFPTNLNIPIHGLSSRGIFGILTTTSAYTPKNGGRITLRLVGYR